MTSPVSPGCGPRAGASRPCEMASDSHSGQRHVGSSSEAWSDLVGVQRWMKSKNMNSWEAKQKGACRCGWRRSDRGTLTDESSPSSSSKTHLALRLPHPGTHSDYPTPSLTCCCCCTAPGPYHRGRDLSSIRARNIAAWPRCSLRCRGKLS